MINGRTVVPRRYSSYLVCTYLLFLWISLCIASSNSVHHQRQRHTQLLLHQQQQRQQQQAYHKQHPTNLTAILNDAEVQLEPHSASSSSSFSSLSSSSSSPPSSPHHIELHHRPHEQTSEFHAMLMQLHDTVSQNKIRIEASTSAASSSSSLPPPPSRTPKGTSNSSVVAADEDVDGDAKDTHDGRDDREGDGDSVHSIALALYNMRNVSRHMYTFAHAYAHKDTSAYTYTCTCRWVH